MVDSLLAARFLLALFALVASVGAYLAVCSSRRRVLAVAVAVGTLLLLGAIFVMVDLLLLRQI